MNLPLPISPSIIISYSSSIFFKVSANIFSWVSFINFSLYYLSKFFKSLFYTPCKKSYSYVNNKSLIQAVSSAIYCLDELENPVIDIFISIYPVEGSMAAL